MLRLVLLAVSPEFWVLPPLDVIRLVLTARHDDHIFPVVNRAERIVAP